MSPTLKRVLIPMLLLLIPSLYFLKLKLEPGWRYGRILSLLRTYQGKPHSSWSDADGNRLWENSLWEIDHAPDWLAERLAESIAEGDDPDREAAMILGSELRHYNAYGMDLSSFWAPSILPLPPRGKVVISLKAVPLQETILKDPRVSEWSIQPTNSSRVRRCYLRLAAGFDSPDVRSAHLRLISSDPDKDLRVLAIQNLGYISVFPVGETLLLKLMEEEDSQVRIAAARSLSMWDSPAGTAGLLKLVFDLNNKYSKLDRLMPLVWLKAQRPRTEDSPLEKLYEATSKALDHPLADPPEFSKLATRWSELLREIKPIKANPDGESESDHH